MKNEYKIYCLREIIGEITKKKSYDLVTRQTGAVIRRKIEGKLEKELEGQIVILDFSRVGIVDYSCADEVIAKLLSRLVADEYSDKYILLKNLQTNQEENIQVALERKKLAIPSIENNKNLKILGILNLYLKEAFNFVNAKKEITARELADLTKTEINSASTKLLNLYKARLLTREAKNLADGGREFVYKALF